MLKNRISRRAFLHAAAIAVAIGVMPSDIGYRNTPRESSSDKLLESRLLKQTKVVFTSNGGKLWRKNLTDLYLMNADGTLQKPLLTNSAINEYPSWFPNGKSIVFASNLDANLLNTGVNAYTLGGGPRNIYRMDINGGEPQRLTRGNYSDLAPQVSPDGRQIAFYSDRNGQLDIFVMPSNGGNLQPLTDHYAKDMSPTWAPDGRIAFSSNRKKKFDIYVRNSDGSLTNLTEKDAGDHKFPSWSPDGSMIAYTLCRGVNSEIYVMGADGSNPKKLTPNPQGNYCPSWSPDSKMLVYHSWVYGDPQICHVDVEGNNIKRLTDNASKDTFPVCSPILVSQK